MIWTQQLIYCSSFFLPFLFLLNLNIIFIKLNENNKITIPERTRVAYTKDKGTLLVGVLISTLGLIPVKYAYTNKAIIKAIVKRNNAQLIINSKIE